jgi:hypothetical protein
LQPGHDARRQINQPRDNFRRGIRMYKVHADIARNRLYITLAGFLSLEEAKACGDEAIALSKKLKAGYDVLTDITEFKPGTQDVAKDIERVQAHFKNSGARRGARVVGQNAASSMQFNRTGKAAGFSAVNVATLADAEKFLSEP